MRTISTLTLLVGQQEGQLAACGTAGVKKQSKLWLWFLAFASWYCHCKWML